MKRTCLVPGMGAGVAVIVALAAAVIPSESRAQTYYVPDSAYGGRAVVVRPQASRYGEPRFYIPFLKPSQVYEEPAPGYEGAYATAPSGRRVFYVPAPREEEEDDTYYQPQQAEPQQAPGTAQGNVAQLEPRFRRQIVPYHGQYKAGTIVISTAERFLYLVQEDGTALRYGVGVGREGFSWHGENKIARKAEWPDWRPPAEMIARRPDLPRFMPGGPSNPLGARALYLGTSLYRIHGTNEPHTIGKAVSSGCIRMVNEDVIDLYSRVGIGTRVVVN